MFTTVRDARRTSRGFSLVELLVVIAIIGIIASFYMGALSKALRKAKDLRAEEGIRQDQIGRMADNANGGGREPVPSAATVREDCRAAFREWIDVGQGEKVCVTRLLFRVRDAQEFKAYWHAVIDPSNTDPVMVNSRGLTVTDAQGNPTVLPAEFEATDARAWEFLAVKMGDTTMNGLGVNVLYGDSHIGYVKYPGDFPVCAEVAQLGTEFVQAYGAS